MLRKLENINRFALSVLLVVATFSLATALLVRFASSVLETAEDAAPQRPDGVAGVSDIEADHPRMATPGASDYQTSPMRDPKRSSPASTDSTDSSPARKDHDRAVLAFDWREEAAVEVATATAAIRPPLLNNLSERELSNFERKRHKAAQGLSFRLMTLKDEKGTIPADGLEKAKKQVERMKNSRDLKAKVAGKDPDLLELAGLEPGSWTWLGPGNVGGRIRSIVIDPNNADNMWVGSVSGGIWKTNNGGTTWQPVDDFMANLAVSTIVMHPTNSNEMYAGTGEGFVLLYANNPRGLQGTQGAGIFQTADAGVTWTRIASTDPSTPTPGCVPIIGSAPCSNTWSFINRLAIGIQSNGTEVILAATNNGMVRTTDDGATWTQTTLTPSFDLDFDPTNPALAVTGEQGSASFSTDGGQNWQTAIFNPAIATAAIGSVPAASGRVELAYAPSNPQIVYALVDQNRQLPSGAVNQGDLFVSNDGGRNYNLINSSNPGNTFLFNQGWYDNIVWVKPSDPNFVLVGGVNMYQSGDGGATFTIKANGGSASAHSDHHVIAAHPQFNNSTNKTVYFGNDGGVYRVDNIDDFSISHGWTELNNNLGITQFYSGTISANGTIFGGTQDNGTIRVTPTPNIDPPYNTESWSQIAGSDGSYVAADPTDASYLYGATQNLGLFRSTDGGATNSSIIANIADSTCTGAGCTPAANFIAPFILDPNDPNTLLAGGLSLWSCPSIKAASPTFSISKCATAAPNAANQGISAIAVAPGNSDLIVVGHNDGQIYLTQNGTCIADGTCTPNAACPNSPTWTRIDNLPTPPDPRTPARFVTRLAIDDTKAPNWIYATFGGFSNDNVWVTRDLGNTWTDVSGTPPAAGEADTDLPAVPVRSIVMSPANPSNLYVGTEIGIFVSEDAGTTWLLPNGGPANVSVDELFWNNGDLFAATHGRGMYKTHTPVIDTAKCAYENSPSCTNPDPCPSGEIRCSAIGCGCCKAGDWSCPCSWGSGKVPTQDDDALVACPMTGGGVARNLRVTSDLSTTGLHAFGDLINSGKITAFPGFAGVSIAADRDLLNLRPENAVTTRGIIQIPGWLTVGGVLGNYGIIAVGDQVTTKGFASGEESTLTLARGSIEGNIDHRGLLEYNGVAPTQASLALRSPIGMTSTFKGLGRWNFPNVGVPSLSTFRLESNVSFAGINNFANGGTIDVQDHTLTFGGSQFSNTWQNSSPNDFGFLGTGTVIMAPTGGIATFATNSNATQFRFTPGLRIASGNVDVAGGHIGPLTVDGGATAEVESLYVNGDIAIAGTGSMGPLGNGTLFFNGGTLTNNGTIGNLFLIYFNTSGAPREQTIGGVGTWSQRNVQLGLYSTSTTTLSLENDITFNNSSGLTIATGSELSLGTRELTLNGPTLLSNDGSITGHFGLLRLQGTGIGARVGSGRPNTVFGSPIEIASGQVSVYGGSTALTFTRPLQINTGATFTMTGPSLTATSEVTNEGTIGFQTGGAAIATFQYLGPRFVNSGSVSGSGGLIFWFGSGINDSVTRQLSGSGSWSGLAQFQINAGSTLELLNDVTVTGNSLYSFGTINTGAFTLSLPCNVPWGGPGETFGNVRRTNLSACSGAVAFGNPFTTVQFTGGTVPSEVTMGISPSAPAGFPGAIQRSYDISAFGGGAWTANVRLHYLDSELNGNTESSLTMHRSDGTAWSGLGATSRNSTDNWVELTGVTQFSLWTLSSLTSPPPPNTPPTLGNIQITSSINEGGTATLTGTISDPNAADTFSLSVSWGDGTQNTYNYPAGTTSFSETHVYADNPNGAAAFNVGLSLSDSQSGTATGSASVAVANVAPTITALSATPATMQTGTTLTLNGSFSDPGTGDAHGVVIEWGDGSTPTEIGLAPGISSFSATHAYAIAGPYTITVTVADDDTGIDSETTGVTVTEPPPTPPAAPSNLTATPASRTQIDLTWADNSGNEDGFVVELCGKGKNCGSSTVIGQVAAGETSFSHTGLKAGATYKYRVRAFNAGGSSGYSNIATAKTPRK